MSTVPKVIKDTPFETWWHNEGSGMRPTNAEQTADFALRISRIAWQNAEFYAKPRLHVVPQTMEAASPHGFLGNCQICGQPNGNKAVSVRFGLAHEFCFNRAKEIFVDP